MLGIPVVNIGSRQNRRKRGKNVIDCGYESDSIQRAIEKQINYGKRYSSEYIYGDGNAGDKIANILATVTFDFQKTITY